MSWLFIATGSHSNCEMVLSCPVDSPLTQFPQYIALQIFQLPFPWYFLGFRWVVIIWMYHPQPTLNSTDTYSQHLGQFWDSAITIWCTKTLLWCHAHWFRRMQTTLKSRNTLVRRTRSEFWASLSCESTPADRFCLNSEYFSLCEWQII